MGISPLFYQHQKGITEHKNTNDSEIKWETYFLKMSYLFGEKTKCTKCNGVDCHLTNTVYTKHAFNCDCEVFHFGDLWIFLCGADKVNTKPGEGTTKKKRKENRGRRR